MRRRECLAVLPGLVLAGCGYRVAGRGDLLPTTLRTIAIPAFGNVTTRYRLTDRLPIALTREFHARTRYRIVAEPEEADAVLRGTVTGSYQSPIVYDPERSRAAAVIIAVSLSLQLTERSTGKVLFHRPSFEARERYELSTVAESVDRPETLNTYFDESDAALERLSSQVAKSAVSAILEAF